MLRLLRLTETFRRRLSSSAGVLLKLLAALTARRAWRVLRRLLDIKEEIEKERRKQNISTMFANNGLTNLIPIAGDLTTQQAAELLEKQGTLAGRKTVGVPRKYADGSMQWLNEDGSATLMTASGQSINSKDSPDVYKAALARLSSLGQRWMPHLIRIGRILIFLVRYGLTREKASIPLLMITAIFNICRRTQTQYWPHWKTASLDTGPLQGLYTRFGWGDVKQGELRADAIYTTLLNLQITRLTPVTEKELALVSQLWADPSAINDQNIGALRSATKRINRGLERLDQTIESKLEDAEFYVGDEFASRYRNKWERAKSGDITGGAPLVLEASGNDARGNVDYSQMSTEQLLQLPILQK